MKVNLIAFMLIFVFHISGYAQPTPFRGTLLFNLAEKEYSGEWINVETYESKQIRLLSKYKDSELSYDTLHKAFAFTTNGAEHKEFAIIYQNDTMFINYPSLPFLAAVYIKSPIPLNGKSFSFSNPFIYDAIHSNKNMNGSRIFYLCQGCLLSTQYEMKEEKKQQFNKKHFTFMVNLKK